MANKDIFPDRRYAFDVLRRITFQKLALDVALSEGEQSVPDLSPIDRAFARNLIMTTLKALPLLDHLLDGAMDRPLMDRDLPARNWMRIGLAQIFFMSVEDHAAVHSTVELMSNSRTKGVRDKKGMANAILRRMAREQEKYREKIMSMPAGNIPEFWRNRWETAYGSDALNEMAQAFLNEAPLDIYLKNPEKSAALMEEFSTTHKAVSMSKHTVRFPKATSVTALSGFDEGDWWVQDFAASLPVLLLGDVKGKSVADVCAAPGGKALQLAAMGAIVAAIDVSKKRLKRVYENLTRTKLSASVFTKNALKWEPSETFDAILLDAPCTATGTMRRHPDVALHKNDEDIEKVSRTQGNLIQHVTQFLKPDGKLIYCTCSLEKEEGEDIVQAFLEKNPTFQIDPISVDELSAIHTGLSVCLGKDGSVRTLPHSLGDMGGMDGFYIARIVRKP